MLGVLPDKTAASVCNPYLNDPVSVNLPFVILMKAVQSDQNVNKNLLLETGVVI